MGILSPFNPVADVAATMLQSPNRRVPCPQSDH
jgi:hypothetical protein